MYGEVIAPTEDGRVFHFTVKEEAFLVALSQVHDMQKAAESIGKDLQWAQAFFKKPKNREWVSLKARQHAARTGTTQEWWYAFGRAVLAGKFEYWEGACSTCDIKLRTYMQPEEQAGVPAIPCDVCGAPVLMNKTEIPVKPTREQIVVWQELGARAVPKIERIQHEFTDETYSFKAQGDNDAA